MTNLLITFFIKIVFLYTGLHDPKISPPISSPCYVMRSRDGTCESVSERKCCRTFPSYSFIKSELEIYIQLVVDYDSAYHDIISFQPVGLIILLEQPLLGKLYLLTKF